MKAKRIALFFTMFCAVLPYLWGQDSTIVFNSKLNKVHKKTQLLGLGTTSVLDTYLSPQAYTGAEIRYIAQKESYRSHKKWSVLWQHQVSGAYVSNAVKNNKELHALYHLTFAMPRILPLQSNNFSFKIGPMADTSLGFIYNSRNSNNPAQALLHLNMGVLAQANYIFALGKYPFSLNYQCSLPLLGAMFSPNYGQSYYETFTQGVYNHNIVFTTPINRPSLYQLLSLHFSLANNTLSVSYAGNHLQSKVNGLRSHLHSHTLMVGIVKHFQFIPMRP